MINEDLYNKSNTDYPVGWIDGYSNYSCNKLVIENNCYLAKLYDYKYDSSSCNNYDSQQQCNNTGSFNNKNILCNGNLSSNFNSYNMAYECPYNCYLQPYLPIYICPTGITQMPTGVPTGIPTGSPTGVPTTAVATCIPGRGVVIIPSSVQFAVLDGLSLESGRNVAFNTLCNRGNAITHVDGDTSIFVAPNTRYRIKLNLSVLTERGTPINLLHSLIQINGENTISRSIASHVSESGGVIDSYENTIEITTGKNREILTINTRNSNNAKVTILAGSLNIDTI